MVYKRYTKRIIDIILSIIGLVLLSPIFLIIALCIKADSEGPILFRQLRIGKDKKNFYILKFRTMYVDTPADSPTSLLADQKSHVTRVGRFLRKSSLDELPQIINIFKGEMSIIGPRPVIPYEHDLIIERDKRGVYSLIPGLTGWAQINGRDEVSFFEKAKLDGEYLTKISFLFDVKIFLFTIVSVIKSEGFKEGDSVVDSNASKQEEIINELKNLQRQ
jgi:O-antigen biosynthesis protein WbqP